MYRFTLCSLIASGVAISAIAPVTGDWRDVWDSSPPDVSGGLAGVPPTNATEWDFKDPALLFLSFQSRDSEDDVLTWLHPTKRRIGGYEEAFMPGHEETAEAFGYQIIREAAEGYEVSFQPIDPITGAPLPLRDTIVLFSRSRRTLAPLSEKLKVLGFYGNPHMQRPW